MEPQVQFKKEVRINVRSTSPDRKCRQEYRRRLFSVIRKIAARYFKPFIYTSTIFVLLITLHQHFQESEFDIAVDKVRSCIAKELNSLGPHMFWFRSLLIFNACGETLKLDIREFENQDEIKYHIPPRLSGITPCHIVTLGVGRDVVAEQKMWRIMPWCKFYGADPVAKVNSDLFNEVGTFFPVAVGASQGMVNQFIYENQKENIPNYRDKVVETRELFSFLRDDVQQNVVDQVMMDIEKAEYQVIEKFLDANRSEEVIICQINIEFHPNKEMERKIYYEFMKTLIEERHFLPLKISVHPGVDVKRIYFLNIADKVCRDRYAYNPKQDAEDRLEANMRKDQ